MKRLNNSKTIGVALILFSCIFLSMPSQSSAADTVQLDILYMNHGPMRPTISKIKDLLGNYGDTVQASWYDVELASGKSFMKQQKITGHIPMLIMIDGQTNFSIDDRDVILQGFPTGASPFKQVEGNWSVDDLQLLLDKKVR